MKPVMILVVLVAGGLAAYFAFFQKDANATANIPLQSNDTTKNLAYIDPTIPSQGVPAQGEPEWEVSVELEKLGTQNKFRFKIREKHGWAANGVYLALWHRSKDPATGEWVKDSRETKLLVSSAPLRFGQVLEYSTTLAVYEVPEIKDFGASENWAASVVTYSDLTAPK